MSMHSSNHNEFPVPQNRQRPDNNHHQAHQFHRSSASLDTTFSPSAMSGPTPVFPTTPVVSSSSGAITTMMMMEQNATLQEYHPPGTIPAKPVQWVYNPTDGSVLLDHNGRPVSVDRLLATKPLRHELLTRPGPGNKRLTYISGEGISRTLNDIFGFDGWDLDITRVQREECLKDDKTGKYTVVYTAQVRLTHKLSGTYKEDCGAGDAVDRSFATAVSHALKASITDAMKRAARHFGDKCGNSLYQGNFSINKAPVSLKEALDLYDFERANTKFGIAKDQLTTNASDIEAISSCATALSSSNPPIQQHQKQIQQSVTQNPPGSIVRQVGNHATGPYHTQQPNQIQQNQSAIQQNGKNNDSNNMGNIRQILPSATSHSAAATAVGQNAMGPPVAPSITTIVRPASSYGRPNANTTNGNTHSLPSSTSTTLRGSATTATTTNTMRVDTNSSSSLVGRQNTSNSSSSSYTSSGMVSQTPSANGYLPSTGQNFTNHTTNTYKPSPLQTLPPDNQNRMGKNSITATEAAAYKQPNVAQSTTTATTTTTNSAAATFANKRTASMMSNPYYNQNSYPNKTGRNSL